VTWDDIIALALGMMGLSPAVFWHLSMREWLLLQRGFFNKMEQEYQTRWELARWQTYILALPNAKKGFLNKPEDLVRFPWDAPKENPAMEEDELNEFLRRMGTKYEDGKFVN
jgi:hypothetical protein